MNMKQNNTCTVLASKIPGCTRSFAPSITCSDCGRFLRLVKKSRGHGLFTREIKLLLPRAQFIRISNAASSPQKQFTTTIWSQPDLLRKLVKRASYVWREKSTEFATAM